MNPALKIILIVLAVLFVLACGVVAVAVVIVGKSVEQVGEQMQRAATEAQMAELEAAIASYRADNGELPHTLTDLVGEYLATNTVPTDAWSNRFVYAVGEDGNTFELVSYGADGVEGGEGENADIRLE